jgi:threonine/homoserine/homoserine lactone efflux protein
MIESTFTISIAAFLAGFIFAMPIAGPVSILIASSALKGRIHYSNMISIGASFADFIYVFIAVFGLTKLYSLYKPAIPYLFVIGAIFFIFLGIKIFKKPVDLEHYEDKRHITEKILHKEKGAVYTGFMVNFLNPTLFLSGLTSSFFVISFVASLGLNTGGLDLKIQNNVEEMTSIDSTKMRRTEAIQFDPIKKMEMNTEKKNHAKKEQSYPGYFHLIISTAYALFLAAGGVVWFYILAFLLSKYRSKINKKFLSVLIKGFGIILCILGVYFGFLGIESFLS